ncbi:hypothetical protein ACFL1D_06075 [Candidatus Omnitrophota bacterium]
MNNRRLSTCKQRMRDMTLYLTCCLMIFSLLGCEAFVKKFTRKTKKQEEKEIPVLVPEDYSLSDIPPRERYERYFLFWQSWQDELINVLNESASNKKIRSCLQEAIKNLEELKPFLFEEKQKELDFYLEKLRQLDDEISRDVYGIRSANYKNRAESLKRNILSKFSYTNVKNHFR